MSGGLIPFIAYALAAAVALVIVDRGNGLVAGLLTFWLGGALASVAGLLLLALRDRKAHRPADSSRP